MCRELSETIAKGRVDPDEKERQRWAAVDAAISHFIEGGYITRDLLKQLIPRKFEHWELKCRKPRPSIRVFGRFALPDVFIATHLKRRDTLGGMWSLEFEMEKLACEDLWKAAGLTHPPFSDAPHFRYESYITSAASERRNV